MVLPEPTLTPELKNQDDKPAPVTIVSDQALEPQNPFGAGTNLEEYATTDPINIYTVKANDTLDSIAKSQKTSKAAIIEANSDVKKSELTKVGQLLVIVPVKASTKKETQVAETPKKSELKVAPVVPEETAPVSAPAPAPEVQTNTVASTESLPPQGQPSGNIAGGYIWPFPTDIGSVSQALHADRAVDLRAPIGTPIYAIADGDILIAHPSGYNGGYGKYVVENTNKGPQFIYGHMSKVVAEAGQTVKQGEIIGYVGSTGNSTGPHLHLGTRGGAPNPFENLKVSGTANDFHD